MAIESYAFCLIYLILFIFISILQRRNYRSRRTPLSFFSLLWCIVGFFANLGIMDYENPSFFVNACIALGIIIFTVVFVLRTPRTKVILSDERIFGNNEKINYKWIIAVGGVCWAFMLPRFRNSMQIINLQGYAFLRANLTNSELGISRGGLQDIIFAYMVEPAIIATAILSFFLLFNHEESRKKKYLLFFYALISVLAYAFTSAARGIIIKYAFCFLFALLVCRKKVISNFFKIPAVRYGLIIAAVVVLYITFQRGTWGERDSGLDSILRTFYVYYFSGPAYMTKLMENQPLYGGFGQLLYGQATFGFLTNFISWILILFTGRNQGSLYLLGSVISNVYYNVAPTVRINAMYTCFYAFCIDWGYLGIIIVPAIIALYSAHLFKRVYNEGTYLDSVMYVFWLYILTRTVFKLDTTSVGITIVYLCMLLFTGRRVSSERN